MNNYPMSKNLIMTMGLMTLLSACGDMKQDPAAEYRDVRENLVRPHDNKSREQRVLARDLFDIFPVDDKVLNFVEGETKTYRIKARVNPQVVYDVVLAQGPEGMTLTKSNEADMFLLTWAPGIGHIPNSESVRDHNIVFELQLLPGSDARALSLFNHPQQPVDRRVEHVLHVVRTKQQPVIAKISGLQDTVAEGEKLEFEVEVSDPGASEDQIPQLVPVEVQALNDELPEASGFSFIQPNPAKPLPVRAANGNWIFYRILNTKLAAIPQPLKDGVVDATAGSVVVRFGYKVIGAGGRTSPEKVERVSILLNKKAEAPVIRFATGKSSIDLVTGVERDIEISALVQNPRAKVDLDIEALRASLATLPGAPFLTCEDRGRVTTLQNCRISWAVPCDSSVKSEYPLTVKATAQLYESVEKAELTKTLKIVKKAEFCRPSQPAATTADASAGTVGGGQ
ncbi:MAG: hypothetical protein NDI61_09560 [Bdellovibrionaceae bacterium]|nr:hypothetical protein [Pseudobdellovibrionaceae bacterium]